MRNPDFTLDFPELSGSKGQDLRYLRMADDFGQIEESDSRMIVDYLL
jgi:hypothetical protein